MIATVSTIYRAPAAAKPGDWVICDCFDRVLRVQAEAPGNGLGNVYRVASDGTLRRVVGL